MYKKAIKPFLDVVVATVGFLVLSPILLLVTLLLAIANNGKPFFFQKRPGKNAAIFSIVKFKTMTDAKDADGALLPDAARLTAIGTFVRKTSLDELPQLINVIKGNMSLVGPRPLLPEYLPLYTDFQKQRHQVKPGITGWAQVNGRNAISWQQKFEYDVWYTQNQSFKVDVTILVRTVKKVIFKEDINADGAATMAPFTGNK